MPRYVQPDKPLPMWAMRVSGILGIPPLRLEILKYLHQNADGATSGDIARALGEGVNYKTVLRHLQQLEGFDVVTAHVDERHPRQGQHVVFQLSAAAWNSALEDVKAYVEGREAAQSK